MLSAGMWQSSWLSTVEQGAFQTHERVLDSLGRFDLQMGENGGTVKHSGLVLSYDFFPLPLLKFQLFWHIHEETEMGWNHKRNTRDSMSRTCLQEQIDQVPLSTSCSELILVKFNTELRVFSR